MTFGAMGERVTALYRHQCVSADVFSSVLVFIGAMLTTEGQKPLRRLALIMLDQVVGRLELTDTLYGPLTGQHSVMDHPLTEAGVPGPGMPSERDLDAQHALLARELRVFRIYEAFIVECRKQVQVPGRPEWLVTHLQLMDRELARGEMFGP